MECHEVTSLAFGVGHLEAGHTCEVDHLEVDLAYVAALVEEAGPACREGPDCEVDLVGKGSEPYEGLA